MAHFDFVISQNAKWGHAGFYIDCHRMTVPENILLQKSTGLGSGEVQGQIPPVGGGQMYYVCRNTFGIHHVLLKPRLS